MTDDTLRLTWDAPAGSWEEATPLGNGRIGAMAFGGAGGRYQLNDATAWSGTPDGPAEALARVVAGGAGPERLAEVRRMLAAGDVRAAEALLQSFEGDYTQSFLPFADLHVGVAGATADPQHPARTLDLDDAVLHEALRVPDGSLQRRSWVSAPAAALIVDQESTVAVDVAVSLTTPLRQVRYRSDPDGIVLELALPGDGAPLHETDIEPGLRYEPVGDWDAYGVVALAVRTDGEVRVDGDALLVRRAHRLLIALSTSTRAESWWADAGRGRRISRTEIRDRARSRAERAGARTPGDLGDEHRQDRRRLGRARFAIGHRRDGAWDVQRDILSGLDPLLTATVMAEYGRYLLTSCSRAGNPAANLQGIWNDRLRPAWSSNYTININTEMNYWAAPVLGEDEAFEPLIALVEHVAATGADAARELYGARGWVAHHNTDLWGWSLPVGRGRGAASWALWMMGGVWLCHNLWDRFAFSGDVGLLRSRIWPLLRGATEFCLDWLVADADGVLRTSPSTSPENSFRGPDGAPTPLGHTSSADLFLIDALFARALQACALLEVDHDLAREVVAARARLLPPAVHPDGRLGEWSAEVVEHEPAHRHLSHLVGLYPLDAVTPDRTPELADAAALALDARGPGAMGWSWAWKAALRARLGDGESAAALLSEAFQPFSGDALRHGPVDGSEWGGLLPNLFSTHPPFQIDGNLGFPAAIAEMLLQSHDGTIHALPALPATWADGRVSGLRARSGIEIDLEWARGALTRIRLRSDADRDVVLRVGDSRTSLRLVAGDVCERVAAELAAVGV
jgi:alpha-L-fucosidase 2